MERERCEERLVRRRRREVEWKERVSTRTWTVFWVRALPTCVRSAPWWLLGCVQLRGIARTTKLIAISLRRLTNAGRVDLKDPRIVQSFILEMLEYPRKVIRCEQRESKVNMPFLE